MTEQSGQLRREEGSRDLDDMEVATEGLGRYPFHQVRRGPGESSEKTQH